MTGSATDLSGRRVLVTGAARGIGRGIALRFEEVGARVTALDIDGGALAVLAADRRGIEPVHLDITDAEAAIRFFENRDVPFDVVCANVGYSEPRRMITEVASKDWQRFIDGNLTSVFTTLTASARAMRAANAPGRIIVTASVASITAEPGYAPYAAAKWGVLGLVKSAAVELAPFGILVNAVCPGDVNTAFLSQTRAPSSSSGPLGRPAEVSEIAELFVALAGPAGGYITGEAIVVDGGLSLTAMA